MNQSITFIPDEPIIVLSDDPNIKITVDIDDINVTTSEGGFRGPPGSRVVEIGAFLGGEIAPGELLVKHKFMNPITILPTKCAAEAESPLGAPAANVVFDISMNGTSIGTITFLSSDPSKVGVVNFTTANLHYETSTLEITAPEDLYELGDLNITFSGER